MNNNHVNFWIQKLPLEPMYLEQWAKEVYTQYSGKPAPDNPSITSKEIPANQYRVIEAYKPIGPVHEVTIADYQFYYAPIRKLKGECFLTLAVYSTELPEQYHSTVSPEESNALLASLPEPEPKLTPREAYYRVYDQNFTNLNEYIHIITQSPLFSYFCVTGLNRDAWSIKLKPPDNTTYYATSYDDRFDLTVVPQILIDSVTENSHYACHLAHCLNFDLTKITKQILDSIVKDSGASFDYAHGCRYDVKKIPEAIIDSIAKDNTRCYNFATHCHSLRYHQGLDFDETVVPQKILEGIKGYYYPEWFKQECDLYRKGKL